MVDLFDTQTLEKLGIATDKGAHTLASLLLVTRSTRFYSRAIGRRSIRSHTHT